MAQDTKSLVEPNVYELSGDDTQITYATTGADGKPTFSYSGTKGERSYSGDEIGTLDSALGTEVTVTIDDIADLHIITLTLLIPEMWIAPHSGLEVRTMAIFTTKEEPITAPVGLPAAREQYAVIALDSEGELVDF
jgi:hypothetical protein